MNEKYLQAFALAYMIGWLLARMPKQSATKKNARRGKH